MANINRGFLATLGPAFIALMYQAIDEDERSVLIVAERGGRIVGFVAGAMGMGAIYRRMLRHWPQLFLALLPSAVRPRRLWRILEILRYSRCSGATQLPRAELLSIAVDPGYRDQKIAESLFRQLCAFFKAMEMSEFKIIVGAALAPAHKFYLRMGATPTSEVQVHQGTSSTVYVCTLTQDASQAASS